MRKKLFGAIIGTAAVTSGIVLLSWSSVPNYTKAEFRMAETVVAEDLNPLTTSLSTDFLMLNQINEGLIRLGEGDAVLGTQSGNNWTFSDGLAESASYDPATKTWTFELREAYWTDANGNQLDKITAHDFEFSMRLLVDPGASSSYASFGDYILHGEDIRKQTDSNGDGVPDYTPEDLGVSAIDDDTLTITLSEPCPYFLQLLSFPAFYPVHQETYESNPKKYGKDTDYMAYSGPYTIEHWDPAYGIYLKKNEHYWDKDNVDLNTISSRKMKDSNQIMNVYNAGKLDRIKLTGSQYTKYKEDHGCAADASLCSDLTTESTQTIWYFASNLNSGEAANYHLRKAMALQMDKSKAADTMEPYAPANYFVPPNFVGTPIGDFRDYEPQYNTYTSPSYNDDGVDPAAQAEMDLAYAELSGQPGVEIVDGDEIVIELLVFDSEGWKLLFESIVEDLNKLNHLEVRLVKKPSGDVYDTYDYNNPYFNDSINQGYGDATEWDFGWYGWGPDYPDPMTFLALFKSDDSHNIAGLDQDESNGATYPVSSDDKTASELSVAYDAKIASAEAALATNDLNNYYTRMAEAESLLLDEYILIPVAEKKTGVAQSSHITGIVSHGFGADYSFKYAESSKN